MKKFLVFLALAYFGSLLKSNAQIGVVYGSSNVFVGDQVTYVFQNDFELYAGNWAVSGGTIVWENNNPSTYRYEVGVYWGVAGAGVVRFKDGGYEVSALAVTVNPNPSPPTSVVNGSRCGSGTITLSATPSANANTIRWYSSSSGGSPLYTGTSYTVNVSSTTTYYASSYNSAYVGRESAERAAVSATINPIPSLPSTTDGTVCGSGQVLLMASPGANGNQVRWYEDDMNLGWTYLNSGPSYFTPDISTGRTYYAATHNTSTGCESSATPVNAVIVPIPGLATPIGNSRCGPGEISLGGGSGANGNTVRWYDQSVGGSLLATGSNFNIANLPSTTTYYITSYNSVYGCESSKVGVTATINPVPQTPSFADASRCGPGQITLAVSPGSGGDDIKWFSTSTGPSLVTTGMLYQPTLSSSTTYYVSSLNSTGYCESARVPIVATIYTIPTVALSAGSQAVCSDQAMATVNITNPNGVSGTTFSWSVSAPNISGASSGASSSITQTLTQTTSTNQTATYTVTPVANGCSGTPVQHVVTVRPLPTVAASLSIQSICSDQSMATVSISNPNAVSGTTFSWSAHAPNITGASSGTGTSIAQTLSQSSSANQIATYTITPVAAGCEGSSVIHSVTVKPKPTVALSSSNQSICTGQAMTTVSFSNPNNVSGTAYSWSVSSPNITGASAGTTSFINQTLSQTTSSNQTAIYTITPAANGCSGAALTHTVTVKPQPTAAVSSASQTICSGQTMSAVSITNPNGISGTTYSWTVSAPGITGASGGTHYEIAQTLAQSTLTNQTATYTITPTANGCSGSTVTHTVTVNATSSGGTVSSNTEAYGTANGMLTLSGNNGAVQNWQQKVGSADWTNISNTEINQPYSITSTTLYRAVVKNGVCANAYSAEAEVIVNPLPVVIIDGLTELAPNGTTQLATELVYYSYQWYKNGVVIAGANTQTLTVTQPGLYKVALKANDTSPEYVTDDVDIRKTLDIPLQDMNYVRSTTFTVSGVSEATDVYQLNPEDYAISTTYFDGLGRPVQSVGLGAAGNGNDLITPVVYDDFGREAKKYLPYAHANRDGRYQPTALADQSNFYSNAGDKVADDIAPFSETIFEASPLNRVIKQGAPGLAWQPDTDHTYNSTDHSVKFSYEFNQADEVLQWTFTYPTEDYTTTALNAFGKVEAGTAIAPVFYPANQLYKNKTKDEQGNQVIEYVDKEGRTLLKRVQVLSGNPSTTDTNRDTNWASTYYIYDDFGNLVCVIPPEPSKRLATQYFQAGSTEDSKNKFLKRWAFRYRYDGRQRMIMKQVPGAEPVYMVYDDRDRLVMTQDGNQRVSSTQYWSFTKYDALNRPIATGLKDTTALVSLSAMQAHLTNFYTKPNSRYYEEYKGDAPDNMHGYSNESFPTTNRTSGTVGYPDASYYLTLTYYDDYTAITNWGADYQYNDLNLEATNNGVNYLQPDNFNNRVKGQVAASKIKVLDGGKVGGYRWLKSVNYYDDKYRVIQTLTDNHKGGIDRMTHVIDFVGKTLLTKSSHYTFWKDLVGVETYGNSLVKKNSSTSWNNAGAASIEKLKMGQDGWMEVTVSETNTNRMIGFSDVNTNTHYNTIDYAVYLALNQLGVYENGTFKGAMGTIVIGDVIRIERINQAIKYFKNNTLVYTSVTPSTTDLLIDASLYHPNATLTDVTTSFSSPAQTILRRFNYDHAGRLLSTWHKLNDQDSVLLVHNKYNELGQLIDKKLHVSSPVGGGLEGAKQSVDYAYNIRGWLTHINDAGLTPQAGESKDYFGMELAYNTDLGTGNPLNKLQFNGNINAIKWSNNQGLGDQKENAYNFTYDPLNRLRKADFIQKDSVWGLAKYRDANGVMQSVNAYKEHINSYDLNGNIELLQRSGQDGLLMDDLTYSYGVGASNQSNKLLRVTDAEDDANGFKELNSSIDDYSYDNNGNLALDRNKSTEELVTNGEFDDGNANWTSTESSRLAFVNNRIEITAGSAESVITQEVLIKNATHHVVNISLVRISATGSVNVRVGGSSTNYAISTSTSQSIFSHSAGTDDVKIIVTPDFAGYIESISVHAATAITYNYLNLPETVNRGDEGNIRYIYTATGQKLAQVVTEGIKTKTTDYAGEFIYQNDTLQFVNHEEGRISLSYGEGQGEVGGEAEYQYHLKDHLGNVRTTFTSVPEVEETLATLETTNENEERANFLKYDDIRKVNSTLFDHTNTGSTQYAMRLSGTPEETYGLARSIAVMPGDVISAEVFAKYVDLSQPDVTTALEDFIGAIVAGSTAPGTIIDGGGYGSPGAGSIPYGNLLNKSSEGPGAPKAYLNWIVFDKNFVPLTPKSGFDRISTSARENGSLAPEGIAHEQLFTPIIEITEPGYVYIYLSNEEAGTEVYFDDFKVTHTKSPVLDENFYYPFGMIAERNSREGMTEQSYLYNGKELQDELDLGWYDYIARQYDPSTGRFISVDPAADLMRRHSPYNYAFDNPLRFVDYDGMVPTDTVKKSNQNAQVVVAPPPTILPVLPGTGVGSGSGCWVCSLQETLLGIPGSHSKKKDEKKTENEDRNEEVEKPAATDTEDENVVYRGGPFTDMNFTPRPGVDDVDNNPKSGLSTNRSHNSATRGKGGKSQVLDLEKLKSFGFTIVETKDGHVSIRPPSNEMLKNWAASRPGLDSGNPAHVLTRMVQMSVVRQHYTPPKK